MGAKTDYEFINSQTGNIIAHLSLSITLDKNEHTVKLENTKILLAGSHKLKPGLIYWQDKKNSIR